MPIFQPCGLDTMCKSQILLLSNDGNTCLNGHKKAHAQRRGPDDYGMDQVEDMTRAFSSSMVTFPLYT